MNMSDTFESLRRSNRSLNGNWRVESAEDRQSAKSVSPPRDVWTRAVVLLFATIKFLVPLESRTSQLSCSIKVVRIQRSRQKLRIFA